MSNLDIAQRLLIPQGEVNFTPSESRVRLSMAYSLVSIAESLERISTMPDISPDLDDGLINAVTTHFTKPTMVTFDEPAFICCGGNPVGRCPLCGCNGGNDTFYRVVCPTHSTPCEECGSTVGHQHPV